MSVRTRNRMPRTWMCKCGMANLFEMKKCHYCKSDRDPQLVKLWIINDPESPFNIIIKPIFRRNGRRYRLADECDVFDRSEIEPSSNDD